MTGFDFPEMHAATGHCREHPAVWAEHDLMLAEPDFLRTPMQNSQFSSVFDFPEMHVATGCRRDDPAVWAERDVIDIAAVAKLKLQGPARRPFNAPVVRALHWSGAAGRGGGERHQVPVMHECDCTSRRPDPAPASGASKLLHDRARGKRLDNVVFRARPGAGVEIETVLDPPGFRDGECRDRRGQQDRQEQCCKPARRACMQSRPFRASCHCSLP